MSGVKVASTSRSMSRGLDAGVVDAADGGLVAQVAGGLVRQGVAAFEDAGALDDPVGIEAETLRAGGRW